METCSLGQTSVLRSVPKSIGLLIIASAFVVGGIWLVHDGSVGTDGTTAVFTGFLSVLFFGTGSVLATFRLIFGSNTPVIFSPTGYADKRLFKGEILWSEIARFSVFSYRSSSQIRLKLTSEGINRLELTWWAKIIGWMNKPLGSDVLWISSSDLDISFPELRLIPLRPAVQDVVIGGNRCGPARTER